MTRLRLTAALVLLAGCHSCEPPPAPPLRLCSAPGPTQAANRALLRAAKAWGGLVELSCVEPDARLYWSRVRRIDGDGLATTTTMGAAVWVDVSADAVGSGCLVTVLAHELGHLCGLTHWDMPATACGEAWLVGPAEWRRCAELRHQGVVGVKEER